MAFGISSAGNLSSWSFSESDGDLRYWQNRMLFKFSSSVVSLSPLEGWFRGWDGNRLVPGQEIVLVLELSLILLKFADDVLKSCWSTSAVTSEFGPNCFVLAIAMFTSTISLSRTLSKLSGFISYNILAGDLLRPLGDGEGDCIIFRRGAQGELGADLASEIITVWAMKSVVAGTAEVVAESLRRGPWLFSFGQIVGSVSDSFFVLVGSVDFLSFSTDLACRSHKITHNSHADTIWSFVRTEH